MMAVQRWSDDTLVVRLTDDPGLTDDLDEVAARLSKDRCHVVLDLTGLDFLSSGGVGKLLHLRKVVMDSEHKLVLCGPGDRVWGILLTAGLDGLFTFAENVTTALTRLQGGQP
jgi:anti-anti-sigma factor